MGKMEMINGVRLKISRINKEGKSLTFSCSLKTQFFENKHDTETTQEFLGRSGVEIP